MCEAIKKDGSKCSYKSKCGSKFCGVHKNFIDTSKSLFTEEEKVEIKIELKNNNNLNTNQMTTTSDENTTLLINFFDGSNMTIDNNDLSIEEIKIEIVDEKKVKISQLALFALGEEDEMEDYAGEEILFCLFKDAVEIIIKSTTSTGYGTLDKDFTKMAEILNENDNERYDDMESGALDDKVPDLEYWVQEEMANVCFNSENRQYEIIWEDDEDVFKNDPSPMGVLEKFHTIKEYINEQLGYEECCPDKIDMNNYKQLYAYALAKEWCDNCNITTTEDEKKEMKKLKEDITPLILKTMYWDIDIDVCERLDDYDIDEDEDKVEGETDDERRTRQYEGEFTNMIDMYGECITDKDDDELGEWFDKVFINQNKAKFKGYYRLVNDFDDARTILTDIYLENSEFKQDLYDKYVKAYAPNY